MIWFNYALARELELIPANHADRMDAKLERALLDTFAVQIVNEYDLEHRKSALDDARRHPPARSSCATAGCRAGAGGA